ncbi:dihydrodipicolinate synthase family protein [Jiangella asiatica]|uniref:N-acetylneuraminate lyase n=1 Tax=Jiangella asiatica TaxID=2530372 RepID=A0A4R5DEZ6_9ACTN|nr:dihydrodipicolinate synthase family protein [Jiangella asiatica]TDE08933.1 N-acetylneuraminate lyase [Jiangella asiatica]
MTTDTADEFELWAATPTPFRPDQTLAAEVVPAQARHLRRLGIDGAFVGGTTGESMALTVDERAELITAWAKERADDLLVGAHVGDLSVVDARRLARHAADAGVDLIAAVAPFYGEPPSVGAIVDYLAEIAAAAPDVPLCYYHIPSMTGLRAAPSAVVAEASARIPSLTAVKFTDGDLLEFVRTREVSENVRVYFGRDELLPAGVAFGATGAIGSLYNVLAPVAREVRAAILAGDVERALALHRPFRDIVAVADRWGSIVVVKELINRFGPDAGPARVPWGRLSEDAQAAVDHLVTALRAVAPETEDGDAV